MTLRMASTASAQGPMGFSFPLILTPSGGSSNRLAIAARCARAPSLKNGNADPAVTMVVIRPNARRVKPLRNNSAWFSECNRWDIDFPLLRGAVLEKFYQKLESSEIG